MRILEKYTGNKTYMFPTGKLATPEVVSAEYSAVNVFTHVIETDGEGQVMFAINNLASMRSAYNIDPSLSEDEAIVALQDILNAPAPEPQPDEQTQALASIAAQLEYQNMMTLEDAEPVATEEVK